MVKTICRAIPVCLTLCSVILWVIVSLIFALVMSPMVQMKTETWGGEDYTCKGTPSKWQSLVHSTCKVHVLTHSLLSL